MAFLVTGYLSGSASLAIAFLKQIRCFDSRRCLNMLVKKDGKRNVSIVVANGEKLTVTENIQRSTQKTKKLPIVKHVVDDPG